MDSRDNSYQPGEYFRRHRENKDTGLSREEIVLPEAENHDVLPVPSNNNAAKAASKAAKRKQNPDASLSISKKTKKWSWSAELIEKLLGYVKEYKTQCELKGIDFEADLQSLYMKL